MARSDGEPEAELILEDRFAIVPEWLLDAEIGDAAVRLYAVLIRYGQSSGSRMPARSTLARRLRKRSTDSVDRAMKELVAIGAVRVEHRYAGSQRLTNAYHLQTSRPGRKDSPTPPDAGSRRSAATRERRARGGRTDATGVAADSGHNPEHLTQNNPSSSTPRRVGQNPPVVEEEVAATCGIEDWAGFVADIGEVRRRLSRATTRWAGQCLATALQFAVSGRGWPTASAAGALRRVAADPESRSPMRLAEAGPWWDEPPAAATTSETANLDAIAAALLEAGGLRVELQIQARRALEEQGLPVTRAAVLRGAYELLTEQDGAA